MVFAANAEAAYIKYESTTYPFYDRSEYQYGSFHTKCDVGWALTRNETKIRMILIPTRIEPIAGTYHGMDA